MPKTGKYLSLKNSPYISRVWFDLTPIADSENVFKFCRNNNIYKIELKNALCNISRIDNSISTSSIQSITIYENLNIGRIVNEMVENYLSNLEFITKRIHIDFPYVLHNPFLWEAIQFLKSDFKRVQELKESIINSPLVWDSL